MNKITTLRQAVASNTYFSTRMNRSSQPGKRNSLPIAFTLALTLLLSLVKVGDVWGQTWTIGSGNTSNNASGITPFTTIYHDGRTQYVYLASELSTAGVTAGLIHQFGFDWSVAGGQPALNVNLKMAHTTATNINALESPTWTNVWSSGSVSPTVNATAGLGYNLWTLTTPFSWNGTNNIIVEVCFDNSSYTSNWGVRTTQFASGTSYTYGLVADNAAGCSMTTGGAASAANRRNRPNARFVRVPACSGAPSVGNTFTWTPSSVTGFNADVIANGVANADVSTNAPFDVLNYNLVSSDFRAPTAPTTAPTYALPITGLINSTANSGVKYQLANYAANNSLRLTATNQAGTLNLVSQASARTISLLVSSGDAATPPTVNIQVNFSDGTNQQFNNNYVVADWYGSGYSFAPIGRVKRTATINTLEGSATQPGLYDLVLNLNAANFSKNITSITITKTNSTGAFNCLGVSILSNSASNYVCSGQTRVLSLPEGSFNFTGLTYQWESSTSLSGPWASINGATSTSYTTDPLTTPGAIFFRCLVTCSNGNQSTASTPIQFNVAGSGSISPSSSTIDCGGQISALPSGANYLWSNNANTQSISIPALGTYSVVVRTNECVSVPSITFTTLNPVTITTNGVLSSLCSLPSSQISQLNYTATTCSPTSYSIVWNAPNGGLQNIASTNLNFSSTGGSLNVPIPSNIPPGTYTGVLNLTNASGCVGSTSISFTVTPTPTLASVTQPSSLCYNPVNGTNASILLTGVLPNTAQTASYSINNGSVQTVTFTSVGTSATVSIPVIPSNNGQTLTITSINCANFTANNTVVLNIINSPNAPTVSASSSTINVGGSVSITGVLSNSSNTMQWYNVATSGTPITLNNNPPDQTIFNSAAIPINFCSPNTTTTYYVQETDALTLCPSARTAFTISTNPLFTNSPSNLLICQSNGSVTMTVNVVPSNSTPVVWQMSTNGTTFSTLSPQPSNTSILTVSPSSTTHYKVASLLPLGCSASVPANYTGDLLFTVGVLDPVTLAASATPQVFCAGQNQVSSLSANVNSSNFSVTGIPYQAYTVPQNAVTVIQNGATQNGFVMNNNFDDGGVSSIPIGFAYNFFGTNFTTVSAGTNGLLMFGPVSCYTTGTGCLGQYNFVSTNGVVFPNVANPGNVIALMAGDQFFGGAPATMKYWNTGIAPTRKFYLLYENVAPCCTASSPGFTAYVILHETTGKVEIHVKEKLNTGARTIGLQDATKTIGACPPGRQAFTSTITTSTSEAWLFSPPISYTYQWSTAGQAISGATQSNYVTVPLNQSGVFNYTLTATNQTTQCPANQVLPITVYELPAAPIPSVNVTACSNNTSATLSATPPSGCTINWYTSSGTFISSGNNLVLNPSTLPLGNNIYYAKSVSPFLCLTSGNGTPVTLTVVAAPLPPTTTAALSYCQGASAAQLTATGTALIWYQGTTLLTGAPTPITSSAATLNYSVTQTQNGCPSNPAPITVTVIGTPSVTNSSLAQAICNGGTSSSVALTSNSTGTSSFTWTATASSGSISGFTPSGNTTSIPSQIIANTGSSAQTVTYAIIPTNTVGSLGCPGPVTNYVITVNPSLTASVILNASTTSVCVPGPITFTATPTNGGTTPSYEWFLNSTTIPVSGQTGPTYTLSSPGAGNQVFVKMTSNPAPACLIGSTTATSATITLNTAPATPVVSIVQSTPSTTICSQTSVTFSVATSSALGIPAYQWMLNGTAIPGATSATYTSSTLSTGSIISLVATSNISAVCLTQTTATSNGITMTVTPLTAISLQPVGVSVCQGATPVLTAAATGTGTLTYQWQSGTSASGPWTNLSAVSYPTALTTSLTTPAAGASAGFYRMIASGTCGSVPTAAATISINTPTAITTAPVAQTVCQGSPVTFTTVAQGTGTISYQWNFNNVAIGSATASSYTIPSLTSTNGGNYSVTVSATCGSVTSANVLLQVTPLTTISAQPVGSTVCAGSPVNLSVAAAGTPAVGSTGLNYSWFLNGVAVSTIPSFTFNTTITNSTLTIPSSLVNQSGNYTVQVQGGCSSLTSSAATVVVNTVTAINTQPSSYTGCAFTPTSLTVGAVGTNLTYAWSVGTTPLTGNSATYSLANPQTSNSGNYTVVVTGVCGTQTSNIALVTINPLPSPGIINGGVNGICVGATETLTNNVTGGVWTSNNTSIATVNASTGAVTGVSAGNVTITYTRTNTFGCTNTTTKIIQIKSLPTAVILPPPATQFCIGESMNLQASNAFGYLWSNGATTQTTTVTTSGSYTVTATGNNGCTATSAPLVISVIPAPSVAPISGSSNLCVGSSYNFTSATANGLWTSSNPSVVNVNPNSGLVTASAAGSAVLTYNVANVPGCLNTNPGSATTAVTVNTPPVAQITVGGATTFCQGGSVTLTANTGASYLWSNGATTQSISATSSGSYTVTVTNASGCSTTSIAVPVTVNPAPNASIFPGTSVNVCAGSSVTLSTGTAAAYAWSNGATTPTISVNTAGTYAVTLTGSNGCTATSALTTVAVTPLPTANITSSGSTSICQGSSVSLSATAGTGNTYLWSTGATTQTISPTASGAYSVTVTNNGCSATSAATSVNVIPTPSASITANGPLTFCDGGSVTLSAPSGNGFTYAWSNGSIAQNITSAVSGSFSVTVSNSFGCSSTSSVVAVTVNPLPAISAISGPSTICMGNSGNFTHAVSGGIYSVANTAVVAVGQASGAITPVAPGSTLVTYTYSNAFGCSNSVQTNITVNPSPSASATPNGATTFCQGGSVGISAPAALQTTYFWSNGSTQQNINATTSGNYSVVMTNSFGCTSTSNTVAVTVNSLPSTTVYPGAAVTICSGNNVTLSTSTAAAYQWSTGANTPTITVNTAGSYTATLTGSNGCTATTAPIVVTVNQTPTATITASGSTSICQGSTVTLSAPVASGYTYLWSNGATTSSITASAAGANTVTVTNNGCSATSAPATITINPVPSASITASGPLSFCAGGSVSLTAPSGNNYTYLWTNGATTQAVSTTTSGSFGLTVTNAFGCSTVGTPAVVTVNPLPAQTPIIGSTTVCQGTGPILSHAVPGGIYTTSNSSVLNVATLSGNLTPGIIGTAQITYTYSNAFGCSNAVTQTFSVNPSPTASISPLGATTFCQGGSVDIQASTGASSYLWSNGATTPTISATTSGAYTVVVSNAFGCTASSNAINVNVNPAPNATIYPGTAVNICSGSSVTLSTGTAAAYLWSNGSTSPTITVNTAGSYSVLLTGSNGCTSTSQLTALTVTPVPVASISANGPTAICQGASVTLTAAPATSYLWNNGATTQSITVSTVGSYFVNVGTGACSATSSAVFVSYNPVPVATITPSGPTTFCQGGQVTLNGPSGNGFTYLWSNGATTQGVTTANPGTFSVTVTNAYGCTATSAAQAVAVNPLPTVTPITGVATLCSNGQSQLANVMTGGIYTSSNLNVASIGNTSGLVSGLGAGTTTISYLYTDINGCSNTVTYPVSVIAAPVPTIAANGATSFCQGGSVGLQASSGTSYLWSTGATTASINVNTAGNYSVTVTAANGCSATSAATPVVINSLPTASILQGATTSFCAGGSAQLSAIPAASYLWSNGATSQTINVLAPGSYSVTVTGTNGCTATSSATVVTQTVLPTATIAASGSTAICQGASVTLTAATASSYLWSNGATTQSITVLNPGSYTVQTSNGSCTATSAPTTISLNPVPSAVITASGPTSFCTGGQVTLTAPAGNNFTYLWSNGSTGATLTTATAGNYSVTVTNAFGCSASSATQAVVVNALPIVPAITGSSTVCSNGQTLLSNTQSGGVYSINNANLASIGQNSGLLTGLNAGSAVVTYTYTNTNGCTSTATLPVSILAAPSATVSANGATSFCQGASLTLNSSAGASYLWNTGATTSSITTTAGGSYFVSVTAANGCASQSQSMTLTVNPLPTVATSSGSSTVCSNGTTLLSNATGGGVWSSSNAAFATVNPSTGLVTGVAAGALNINYTLTNSSGCSAVSSKPMTVITPTAATVSASGSTTICQGASVTLTAATASSYQWSTGATTQSITVAQSGPYSVTTVNNGCTAVSSTTTVTVVNPPVASISANGLTALCSGGSVTLTAAPATTYLWSNGATTASITVSAAGSYSVTSTANGCSATSAPTLVTLQATPSAAVTISGSTSFCQGGTVTLTAASAGSYLWSNGANTQSITVGTAGSYTVNVATNGCAATSTPTVVSILPSPTAVITNTGSTTFCAGGSVVLNAPTAPTGSTFTYVWRLNGNPIAGATAQTYTANAAGTYSLVVTNNQGCTATSANTTVVVNALPTANITATGSTTICAGSSVTLSAPAGAAYVWSNGATTQSIAATTAGAYTVTVNANGCTATSAATNVVVNALPVATISASGATNLCQGSTVTLTASPATTYLWSNGATSPSITVSAAGNYSVTNTTNGCSASSNPTTINVQALPVAGISVIGNTTFCLGGSVTLTASPASSYLWSNGATTQTIVATTAGNYTVQVSANGCSATSTAVPVAVNALPTALITAAGPTTFCQGGTVTLTAATASSYLWSNGATTQSITVNTSGTYGVQQTNALGCSAQATPVVVSVQSLPATPQIVANGSLALCPGATVTLSAPTAASYAWSNGASTQTITVSNAGNYGLTVANAAGCTAAAAPITVSSLAAPTAAITAAGPTTFCQGGSVVLSAAPANSYLWSNGATTQSITVQNAGNYTVQLTANGCSATSAPTTVVVSALPLASITPSGPTTFCQGGSVVLSAPLASSYLWSTGATSQQITVSSGGQYDLTLTSNGCSASASPVLVSVQALPSSNITASGSLTFCEGGSVLLSADPATSYAWSNGQTTQSITVAQTANITLITSNGVCTATSAPVAVTMQAAPALAPIAGVSNACVGSTTTLSNATSGGNWTSFAAGIASVDNNGVVTGLSQGATTVQYSFIYPNGCSVSTSVPFVVNNIAPVSISANGPLSFCSGSSVQLNLPTGYAYNWTNNATGSSILVNTSGSYGATITNAAGCSYQVSPVQVVVNAAPAVAIEASNPSLCSGQSVTLASSLAANTYLWSNGAQTNAITVSQPGTYVLTIQDANGCTGSTVYNLATGITPTATIAAAGPTSFCSGSSVQLNANNYTGGTYLWSNGATTPSVTVNTSGTYAVTITSPSGCTATSNAITLNVLPAPAAAITVSGNTTICSNQSVSLAVSGTGNYLWTNGLTTQSISPTTTGSYGVTVTGSNGCQTSVAPIAITVLTAPTAAISANGPTTFCAGGSVTLTATGGATYVWSNNQTGAQLTPTTSGNYTVTATAANGCQDTENIVVTVNPLPANFIVASGPLTFCQGGSVTLSAQAGNTVLWSNSNTSTSIEVSTAGTYSAQLTSPAGCSVSTNALTVVVNAPTASTLNETALDGYILNGILYTQSGTYVQTTTNAAGCDSTITLNLTLTVGLDESNILTFSVQPNPTDAIFTLVASEAFYSNYVIQDAQGKVVATGNLTGTSTTINIDQVARGIYFLKVAEAAEAIRIVKN